MACKAYLSWENNVGSGGAFLKHIIKDSDMVFGKRLEGWLFELHKEFK